MIKLTNAEKVSRYDALQSAIRHTLDSYRRRQAESEKRFEEARELGVIGAYSKGQADAMCFFISDLERWADWANC